MAEAVSYVVSIGAVAVLVMLSVVANRGLQTQPRLPMQWGLGGSPTWSAPRRISLAFMPGLGALVLLAMACEGESVGLMLVVAAAFVLAHGLHLALVLRAARS